MQLCVFEDAEVCFLEPLTLTRPAFDLRCGAYSLWQRQQAYFKPERVGTLVRSTLTALCQLTYPDLAINDRASFGDGAAVFVNARWLPPSGSAPDRMTPRTALVGEQLAYAVVPADQLPPSQWDALPEYLNRWKQSLPQESAGGAMIDYPWDLVERNADILCADFPRGGRAARALPEGVQVVGPRDQVLIDPTATIEPMVVANTTEGPVVIDRDAVVQAFSRLEGPCYIGPGTWVVGGKIRGSSIGPMCRVGGEVESTIIQGYSNKYHDGFLGHSYLGEWVNLAAGTQVSDLRNDYAPIKVTIHGQKVDTGLTKVGAFIGDHSKTGLTALLNTGTVMGAFCNLLPTGRLSPRVLPSFCEYRQGQIQPRSDWRAMLTTAAKVMQRRGRELTSAHTDLFITLYDQTAPQRKQVLREGEYPALRKSM
jgi:UDP-N-acetylglucosamine diphosphorylase/glucosamine-1-phosphate N-acetyltransferase